jgi:3-deoxy-manno-octulosonate cytidylyltransferase (CMP-KDO synthetase)
MKECIGIIPARFASSRFPGKPLVEIHGKTMIRRVYEQTMKSSSLSDVAVATDDERIANEVISFGGKVFLTGSHHQTGTDRCAEVLEKHFPHISKQAVIRVMSLLLIHCKLTIWPLAFKMKKFN